MNYRVATRLAAALLVTTALAASPTFAQTPAPAPTQTPAPTLAPAQTQAQTARGKQMQAEIEKRTAQLHRQLAITPAEQPQWDAFAKAMRDNTTHMDAVFAQQGEHRSGSALDDMRAYAAITQAHAEDVQHMLPPFEALYTAMPPDQQKAADGIFRQFARQQPIRSSSR